MSALCFTFPVLRLIVRIFLLWRRYIQAVAGVQPEDLMDIQHPLQIDDVVIAPVSWFK